MAGKFMLAVLSLLFRPHFSALPAVLLTSSLVTLAVKFSTKGTEKKKEADSNNSLAPLPPLPCLFQAASSPPLPLPRRWRFHPTHPRQPPNPNTHLLSSHQKRDSSGADRGKSAADLPTGATDELVRSGFRGRYISFTLFPPKR